MATPTRTNLTLASMGGFALIVGRALTESTASLSGRPYRLRVTPAGDEVELRGDIVRGLATSIGYPTRDELKAAHVL